MKIIIIGLGNFGSHLGQALMKDGHEVIGVDNNMQRVEQVQDEFTHTVAISTTIETNLAHLPLEDADLIIITIGEDVGASITTTALIKKNYTGRIIARAITPVHETVLEAMKITEIVKPEKEFAQEFANRILLTGAVKSMDLPGEFEIVEIAIPKAIVGMTLTELDIKNKYDAHIVTVVKQIVKENYFGNKTFKHKVHGVMRSTYVFEEDDLLLVFGRNKNIANFIKDFQ
ncbi:MAG: TrkA family potassium uptake protein [Flavobacteriales bacterium]|nr:TrkA family potassium uptake protein [Flavobacteriales bacterium]